jgi:hypothetical protein
MGTPTRTPIRTPRRRAGRHAVALLVAGLTAAGCTSAAGSSSQATPTTDQGIASPPAPSARSSTDSGSRTSNRSRWLTSQIETWPTSDTHGANASLAWNAQLLASGQLIFASHACANNLPICKHGSPSLEVLDIRTHRTLATSPRYAMLAVGDSRLWATDTRGTSPELVALHPRRLTPAGAVKLPGPPTTAVSAAAVAGANLWAAAGTTLSEISTNPLHIARILAVGGQVTDMATSPNGKALWDVIGGPARPVEVQVRSGTTGAVEGTWKPPPGIVGLGGLTADNAGVWVAQHGGMTTVLTRLQAAPLRVTIRGGEPVNASGRAHFDLLGEPITALDADNILWTDISGQVLTCDTPTASATRSQTPLATLASTIGDLVATGSDLFVATPQGIELVRPPTACK